MFLLLTLNKKGAFSFTVTKSKLKATNTKTLAIEIVTESNKASKN